MISHSAAFITPALFFSIALQASAAPGVWRTGNVGSTARHVALPATNRNCQQKKFGSRDSGTFGFPEDCGSGGSITVPDFYQSGSFSEFGMNDFFCESPQLITTIGKGKFCYGEPSPAGHCQAATSTFWYMEIGFHARTLDGYGGVHIQFLSNTFPITFSSSTLVVPGNLYGLCILASGSTMQDDFASGNAVAPNGNAVNLAMMLSDQYVQFDYGESFILYLEAEPTNVRAKGVFRR